MISNAEAVTSLFGYWPDFADAKVASFGYEQSGVIRFELFYIDASLSKSALVGFRFTGVHNLDMGELSSENVVDALTITHSPEALATLEPCIGLGGSFAFNNAEVTHVVPNYALKRTCAE